MVINFDTDGTLIRFDGTKRPGVVAMAKQFQKEGHTVNVWSGNGADWASKNAEKVGLRNVEAFSKDEFSGKPDIAVDDEEFDLGKRTIKV